MITFLPCADFDAIARLLDDKRLGGQRTEAWAILKWLRAPQEYPKLVKAGYCAMWSGYEEALVKYVNAMLREWARRGKKNDVLKPGDAALGLKESASPPMPPWLGEERLHSCHRDALMAKLPSHYGRLGWSETGTEYDGSYLWPERLPDGSWVLRWPKAARRPHIPIGGEPAAVAASPSSEPPATPVQSDRANTTCTTGGRKRVSKRARGVDAASDAAPPPAPPALASGGPAADRAALVEEWERLTKRSLPELAKAHKWPIRFDHCFQRVALDAAFGGCWYEHLDRKKGAAIKQIGAADLARAVAAARRMAEEGAGAVREMDQASLRWRGKQPKLGGGK